MQGNDRAVHVATVTQDRLDRGSSVALVEETLERLDRAAYRGPDIACLPETFSGYDAEPAPGPTTERLSRWARDRSCYVICPIRTQVAGRTFNSAIILDRRGEIVGRYDKIHLTEGELAQGVTTGDADPPVFQTDFGTIGVQICFDVNWPESSRRLKEKGAEIVFWPSAFPAHRQLSSLAWMNEFYIVSATKTRASRVYDITGEVIAQSGYFQPWADATLHLGKRLFEIDYNTDKVRKLQQKYGGRALVQWSHDESWFTLASQDPGLSVEELMDEFGLVPLQTYLARCQKALDDAREIRRPRQGDTRGHPQT
jgi:beta-ureidopropionase